MSGCTGGTFTIFIARYCCKGHHGTNVSIPAGNLKLCMRRLYSFIHKYCCTLLVLIFYEVAYPSMRRKGMCRRASPCCFFFFLVFCTPPTAVYL